MIKESIFSFLKIRKVLIIIFTGIVVIFGILFYLYDIPFDAIIYGCELSFVWSAVCLFIDFYKYYKRHKLLHINREQFFDDAEQLPEHMDIIEYDYQELAKELYQAKQELISKNRIARKELLDYYGMWVHQIKTPIAALDILLQNTEQFLYEEDIVNSRINKRLEIIQESIPVSDMKMELFKIEQYVEMALNYLRVEDISSDLSFKQYAVDDMVRQVIRKYAKIFISKKIKMNFKPTGRYIVTDDKWFVFVLEQLISNALKYTKKGQISIYMKEKSQLTNLQTEIQTRYDSLSKRLKQVAKYILDNSDSIVFDTVAVIAEKADVPPSTLIRFASEFGFSGFNEMKQIFRENLMEKTTNYTERLQLSHKIAKSEGEESPEDILTIFSQANSQALHQLAEQTTNEQINEAAKILKEANNIFIIAPENVDISGDFKEELKTKGVLLPWMNGTNAR